MLVSRLALLLILSHYPVSVVLILFGCSKSTEQCGIYMSIPRFTSFQFFSILFDGRFSAQTGCDRYSLNRSLSPPQYSSFPSRRAAAHSSSEPGLQDYAMVESCLLVDRPISAWRRVVSQSKKLCVDLMHATWSVI